MLSRWRAEACLLQALGEDDSLLSGEVVESLAKFDDLSDQAHAHLAQRLAAAEPHRLANFRLETDIMEGLRRIYILARRIALILEKSQS